jgi:hypothetical protein
MSRQDQFRITVAVAGVVGVPISGDDGTWDNFSGGEVDSESLLYGPGGMEPKISLGGTRTVGEVTVSRLYQHGRDDRLAAKLYPVVGRATVTVTKQSLDIDGNAIGLMADVYTGILKTVTPPEANSDDGGSNPAMIELVMTPSGTIGH